MQVGVLGINYKSSELKVREILATAAQANVAGDCLSLYNFSCVLLSTCNRTEIYFSAEDLAEAHTQLLKLLRIDVECPFEHYLYSYFGAECFAHLIKVTSGFDSVIFGESEIQRQVREAYESASAFQTLPSCIHYIFQKALKVGKNMRSKFQLPRMQASIEAVIHDLVNAFFLHPKIPSILFVGNSEINRKVLHHLWSRGLDKITLATRAPMLAKSLEKKQGVKLLPWKELASWTQFDMIVCGTNQKEYLLKKEETSSYKEPVNVIPSSLIIDLSMPRSVDPQLSRHPQISLFNIEEINAFVAQKQKIGLQDHDDMKKTLQSAVACQLNCYMNKQKKGAACNFSANLL
ncbi:MAG: glutamyl-tRNA reductase [Chlamydiae bacterium]|nr:glutamyl-tRNA reductase [Chlamydiota bacterium]